MPISFLALFWVVKSIKVTTLLVMELIGLSLLIVSAVWGHDFLVRLVKSYPTVFGSSVLAFGHIQNQKNAKIMSLERLIRKD